MADMKELADRIDPRKWEVFEPTSELVKVPRSQLIAASDALREAADMLTVLQSQVAKYERRLEIDHAWTLKDGEKVEYIIPPEERDTFPDGIECRNETIKLQDERIDMFGRECERLSSQVAVARKMAIEECAEALDVFAQCVAHHPASLRTSLDDERRRAYLFAASEIRKMPPTVDIDGLVEKASFDAFAAHRGGNREEAAKDWADWCSDDQKEVWRRTARAVLMAVGFK